MSNKRSDFWIEEHTREFATLEECEPEHGAFLHVIEYRVYESLRTRLAAAEKCVEALRKYADRNNWDDAYFELQEDGNSPDGTLIAAQALAEYEKAKEKP